MKMMRIPKLLDFYDWGDEPTNRDRTLFLEYFPHRKFGVNVAHRDGRRVFPFTVTRLAVVCREVRAILKIPRSRRDFQTTFAGSEQEPTIRWCVPSRKWQIGCHYHVSDRTVREILKVAESFLDEIGEERKRKAA